ncbi:hypothetical protein [Microbacterium foliorum]|uniref:hypothetical protein n=1 Tax=Microbacterium foliorum TaxID=104336 RepID=UPI001E408BBE|nr:hypothetical protein [Microbacterium foliorum]
MSEPDQPPAQPHGAPSQFSTAAPQPPAGPTHPSAGAPHSGAPHSGAPHSGAPYPGTHPGAPPRSSGTYADAQPRSARPDAASASGGSLGRVAFIVALAALGIGLLVTLSFPVAVRLLDDASAVGVFGAIGNLVVLVAAVVAVILGLMSVRRPGQQILAGIAIGISASAIATIVISWASNLVFALAYS